MLSRFATVFCFMISLASSVAFVVQPSSTTTTTQTPRALSLETLENLGNAYDLALQYHKFPTQSLTGGGAFCVGLAMPWHSSRRMTSVSTAGVGSLQKGGSLLVCCTFLDRS
jgi:hypothetical protein